MTVPLLASPFQLGYVTTDLEAAIARMTDRFGAGEFVTLPDQDDTAPRIAIGYAGTMMIELIQPRTTSGDLYSDWLTTSVSGDPGEVVVRLHHVGMLVDTTEELAALRARHVELGDRIAAEGDTPGFVGFLYADTVAELGHYLEYVRPDTGVRELFATVPGSTFPHP